LVAYRQKAGNFNQQNGIVPVSNQVPPGFGWHSQAQSRISCKLLSFFRISG
jgi:hypothetical protein